MQPPHKIMRRLLTVLIMVVITAGAWAEQSDFLEPGSDLTKLHCFSGDSFNEIGLATTMRPWINYQPMGRDSDYEYHIEQLETEAGAYNYDIVPELIGLGLLQQENGEYHLAVDAIQRAILIMRINEGLHSINQIPLLELIIESNIAIEAWEKVTDAYDNMRWLYAKNFAPDDPRLLSVLERIRQWHLEAYNKETGRSLGAHFKVAESLFDQALSIVRNCTNDDRLAMCFWYEACCEDALPEQGTCPTELAYKY